jgi:hypothetical protein
MKNKIFKPSKRDRILELENLYNEASMALQELGMKHGMMGGEFWLEAENASHHTDDYWEAMRLNKRMSVCRRFIEKIENE